MIVIVNSFIATIQWGGISPTREEGVIKACSMVTEQTLTELHVPNTPALQPATLSLRNPSATFKEVSGAPLSHFVSCVHVGHELWEGAGNGAGPDPCHQVNLPPPENPIGQPKRNKDQGLI